MPLFEVNADDELVPFRKLAGAADLYEKQLEDLIWANIEDFTGESLLPIARQPSIGSGGRPDIVALDTNANVVVIEIKRDVDRSQLAQCLEYAGWARTASLDEIAGIHHRGKDLFFTDWQDFTESEVPEVLSRAPRLMLMARDFQGRTESAFEFLIENSVPVTIVRITVYEDQPGRRFIDVEGEHEPELPPGITESVTRQRVEHKIAGRRVQLSDLLNADLIMVGEKLEWERPRRGEIFRGTVMENGAIQIEDGRTFSAPSRAALEAAGIAAVDGWFAWRVPRLDSSLADLRAKLIEAADLEAE